MKKPLLSIGIIFKNEIRCLERCLQSLDPLRRAIPCEVVMADTGADDGSREIAEKYADILIDFPWINDFSAARNAVMDRCSGKWYMTIDCDEWVDSNIQGYIDFLTGEYDFNFASVIIRNYDTLALDKGGSYSDFLATRLIRMSTGLRYEGAVHEHLVARGDMRTMMIEGALFHHDGYVYQNKERNREKQERNMALLCRQLEENPDDLVILTQCIESSAETPEQEGYLRRALAGVDAKRREWELFGAPIYRYAIRMALRDHLPELEEWIGKAEELFPDSIFTRVEIAYFAFGYYWNVDHYEKAIHWGERYLQGVEDYHAGQFNRADLLASSLDKTDTHSRLSVATVLASGYLHENQPEKCAQLLDRLDPGEMEVKQVADCLSSLCRLHSEFGWDTDGRMVRFLERLGESVPDQERAKERQTAFLQAGSAMFTREYRESEAGGDRFYDYAYTAFLPLEGRHPLGLAAAILEASDPRTLTEKLEKAERWAELPIQALEHALELGAPFPPPARRLPAEELRELAARLACNRRRFFPLVLRTAEHAGAADWSGMVWAEALLAAAIQAYPWSDPAEDSETGFALAQTFARIESVYLSGCYAPEVLREERLFALPALHRFGWYCARAFDRLESGKPLDYVRLLKAGLDECGSGKNMIEFLIDHTREVRQTIVPPELQALADQVRLALARFDPNDPAVVALKQSEAYRKVAHILERR